MLFRMAISFKICSAPAAMSIMQKDSSQFRSYTTIRALSS